MCASTYSYSPDRGVFPHRAHRQKQRARLHKEDDRETTLRCGCHPSYVRPLSSVPTVSSLFARPYSSPAPLPSLFHAFHAFRVPCFHPRAQTRTRRNLFPPSSHFYPIHAPFAHFSRAATYRVYGDEAACSTVAEWIPLPLSLIPGAMMMRHSPLFHPLPRHWFIVTAT